MHRSFRGTWLAVTFVCTVATEAAFSHTPTSYLKAEQLQIADVHFASPLYVLEPLPSRSPPGTACAADFNGDGFVDFFDYIDFVDSFTSGSPAADINGDGKIDFFDYVDFVNLFTQGC